MNATQPDKNLCSLSPRLVNEICSYLDFADFRNISLVDLQTPTILEELTGKSDAFELIQRVRAIKIGLQDVPERTALDSLGNLLRMMPNLNSMIIFGETKSELRPLPFKFFKNTALLKRIFSWNQERHLPSLNILALCAVKVECGVLVRFLGMHQDSLRTLHLEAVQLVKGSWVDPLRTVLRMKGISELSLCLLFDRRKPTPTKDPWDCLYPQAYGERIHLASKDEIVVAKEALANVQSIGMNYQEADGSEYYKMDFRRVRAAVKGHIELKNGTWNWKNGSPPNLNPPRRSQHYETDFDLYMGICTAIKKAKSSSDLFAKRCTCPSCSYSN